MTNEPSWDEIFAKRPTPPQAESMPGSEPAAAPAAHAAPAASAPRSAETPSAPAPQSAAPTTRRELREQENAARSRPASTATFATVTGSDGRPPRKRRRLGWLWVLLAFVVVVGGGAYFVWNQYEDQIRTLMGWELPYDYTGEGNGTDVSVVIAQGDTGTDIANSLADGGVTMTPKAFTRLLASTAEEPTFIPGTYTLQEEMSAASALTALENPDNRVISKVLVTEGETLPQVLQSLADGTGVPLEDLQAAADDYTSLGIPKSEPSAEGWLFPATYEFQPGTDAKGMLQQMADVMIQRLDEAGVAEADRHDVLTLASIIQKEGGNVDDFYKVSRVFHNRLDDGMLLQSDATVAYGAGSDKIATTDAQRGDESNLYNTYLHEGLPVGPIAAPGADAIDAAINPADGDWIYFVLVNGETGETQFSSTAAEHEAGVDKWRAWIQAHPDFDQ
jgi:UPF0755 protein